MAFLIFSINKSWLRKMKHRGPTFERLITKRIRSVFSLNQLAIHNQSVLRARKLLHGFLEKTSCRDTFAEKMIHVYLKISKIQKFMKDQIETKDAKVEVLENYWDKMIGLIQFKATKFNDKKVTQLFGDIVLVPFEVRRAMLRRFIKMCRQLHSIAFLQWRLLYCNQTNYCYRDT